MSNVFVLKCDYRENRGACIISKLRELKNETWDMVEEALTVGDYVLMSGEYFLVIERKTWADLAASFKDGRIFENHKKMLDAARAGCRIAYLIEGSAPTPEFSTTSIGGVPVANMMAKLDHFVMRDNVILEFTRNAIHTAFRIIELGKHMSTLAEHAEAENETEDADEKKAVAATTGATATTGAVATIGGTRPDIDSIVKKKYEKTVDEVHLSMIRCIGGVGSKMGTILAAESDRWGDILLGQYLPAGVSATVTAELREFSGGNRPCVYRAMLGKIKGVSPGIASLIAANVPMSKLVNASSDTISTIAQMKPSAKALGPSLAARIGAHFCNVTP